MQSPKSVVGDAVERNRSIMIRRVIFATLVIALPFLFGTAPKIFNDGDTSWHLATGQWILDHRSVPDSDPFSFTMAGQPWVAHEWLADVLLAVAFRGAGYPGVAALITMALTATFLIVFRHLQSRVGPIATFFALMGILLVVAPFILARPHVLVWPLVALWTAVLVDAADEGRAPPWWLPLLMVLWVNLHGSFLLGFIILGALGLDAWWSHGASLRRWIGVGLLCAAVTLINPNGARTLLFPFTVTTMDTLHLIEEWLPSTVGSTPIFFVVLTAVAGLAILRRPRQAPFRFILVVTLLAMAILQVRHQTWLAIVSAVVLPPLLVAGRSELFITNTAFRSLPIERIAMIGTLLLPALLIPFLPIAPREGVGNPTSLLAAVPSELRTKPVFNQYSFGGPLILVGIRPYIDGRADMYGDAFFADYHRIALGDFVGFERAVERYDIRWTILHRGDKRLIRAIEASPRWRRLTADRVGVIHVRQPRR